MTAPASQVDPFDLVIFGGTGDLAVRKLLPALYHRYADGQIQPGSRLIGVARDTLSQADYHTRVRAALAKAQGEDLPEDVLQGFLKLVSYHALDARKDDGWSQFAAAMQPDSDRVCVFYLATSPEIFIPICERLREHGLNHGKVRVVVEKPIGRDLKSAAAINDAVGRCFAEQQTFRIDHYLGKETVQNLVALRFGNALFEPLWNAGHIDHVQITVAETIGVEWRAGFYDGAGALRDMVQNHLLQLLCLVAMEPPASLAPDAIRDEKLKVLRALKPIN